MKTSNRILLIVTGILTAFVVSGVMIIRMDLQEFLDGKELPDYKVIVQEKFDKIVLSSNWLVRLEQERTYKVEIASEDSIYSPSVENVDGTLFFNRDSTEMAPDKQIRLKISVPQVYSIRGDYNVTVDVQNYSGDSLVVSLDEGGYFVGVENQIYSTKFKSRGDVTIDLVDDPNM